MSECIFSEDDMLEIYGQYLQERGFTIFSMSGSQQGRYWYDIGKRRKAPDIVAVRKEMVLVGEGKIKSKDLFVEGANGYSDYQSIVYLVSFQKAYNKLLQEVTVSCKKVGMYLPADAYIQGVVVGGDLFDRYSELITDKRVSYVYVDVNDRKVYDSHIE